MPEVASVTPPETLSKSEIVPRATHGRPDHPLKIGDLEIPCYVLDDGTRVLHQRGMVKSLGMSRGSSSISGGDRLAKFVSGKALSSQISPNLLAKVTSPLKFRVPNGHVAYGYEATILADICDAVLAARAEGRLQKQQEHIAHQCEVLIRGFARVGIIALVDEATGYQEVRKKNDLQKILEAYIAPELIPWTVRFPEEFYKQIFRLKGWTYDPTSVKRPRLVGKLTVDLIYDRLPNGVLEALREKNPMIRAGVRRHKHHQFLTEDIGDPHLEKQLAVAVALLRASTSWQGFKRLYERASPSPKTQHAMDFDDELDDETI